MGEHTWPHRIGGPDPSCHLCATTYLNHDHDDDQHQEENHP